MLPRLPIAHHLRRTLAFLVCGALLFPALLPAQEIRRALSVTSSPNDQARFLAGLPLPPESPLQPAQASASYLQHFQTFGRTWSRFQREHFEPKRNWALTEWTTLAPPARVLYYLFSGPDFINAAALFPTVDTIIMVGLEPIGELPAPETLDDARIAAGLENLRKSTDTTLNFSFFITKDMRVDLEQTDFRGVLPILYTFIALAGYNIESVRLVGLDQNGKLADGSGRVPGVEIQFRDPSSVRIRTLYYFRGDLSNGGLNGNAAGLLQWMRTLPKGAAYLKAASYLLHESYFSVCRDFLLTHSTSILQDDSGIPLRFFTNEDWELYFFGTYTQPIELFATKTQPELRRAYETNPVRPLPFGTGYNWRPGESNLMLAVRRGLRPTPPIDPLTPTPPTNLPAAPLSPAAPAAMPLGIPANQPNPSPVTQPQTIRIAPALPVESPTPQPGTWITPP
jgi:hypothetical protein